MESIISRGPRPTRVKVAVALWGAGALLNLTVGAAQTDWHDWVMHPTFAVLVTLSLLLLWFLYQGKNWARWLLVALVCYRLLMLMGHFHRMGGISGYDAASVALRLVLQVSAMFLLFSQSAASWFRGGNHAG
jgi:hypothetical protein